MIKALRKPVGKDSYGMAVPRDYKLPRNGNVNHKNDMRQRVHAILKRRNNSAGSKHLKKLNEK